MNHTASGLPKPDRIKRHGAGTKHTTNRNTLLLKSFCVTRKKCVGEHESIDYINFVTITRNAVRLGWQYTKSLKLAAPLPALITL